MAERPRATRSRAHALAAEAPRRAPVRGARASLGASLSGGATNFILPHAQVYVKTSEIRSVRLADPSRVAVSVEGKPKVYAGYVLTFDVDTDELSDGLFMRVTLTAAQKVRFVTMVLSAACSKEAGAVALLARSLDPATSISPDVDGFELLHVDLSINQANVDSISLWRPGTAELRVVFVSDADAQREELRKFYTMYVNTANGSAENDMFFARASEQDTKAFVAFLRLAVAAGARCAPPALRVLEAYGGFDHATFNARQQAAAISAARLEDQLLVRRAAAERSQRQGAFLDGGASDAGQGRKRRRASRA